MRNMNKESETQRAISFSSVPTHNLSTLPILKGVNAAGLPSSSYNLITTW